MDMVDLEEDADNDDSGVYLMPVPAGIFGEDEDDDDVVFIAEIINLE